MERQPTRLWGRSTQPLPRNAPGITLARVEYDEPRPMTAYLFPWVWASNNLPYSGAYRVSYGAGGMSNSERILSTARGTAFSVCASVLQIDTEMESSAPPNASAKAFIGLGAATPFELNLAASAAPSSDVVFQLPMFTTSVRVMAAQGAASGGVLNTGRLYWGTGGGPTSGLLLSDVVALGGELPMMYLTEKLTFTAGPEAGGTQLFLKVRGLR